MVGGSANLVFYAKTYHPIQSGSIDGTDVLPHDNAVYRAHLCSLAGLYDPCGDPKVIGDPHCILFVGRLSHLTDEESLRNAMSKYGRVKQLRLVRHIVTGASRGYAFVEYETEREMRHAYEGAYHSFINDSKIIVEYNRQQLMPGWIPRRLGGGLGGRKESGQLRFGGRDRPFRAPLSDGRPIPLDELKRLGIPPPPGHYMKRNQIPSPPWQRRSHNQEDLPLKRSRIEHTEVSPKKKRFNHEEELSSRKRKGSTDRDATPSSHHRRRSEHSGDDGSGRHHRYDAEHSRDGGSKRQRRHHSDQSGDDGSRRHHRHHSELPGEDSSGWHCRYDAEHSEDDGSKRQRRHHSDQSGDDCSRRHHGHHSEQSGDNSSRTRRPPP